MHEYAVYKGDDFLFIGTARECAERLGIKTKDFHYFSAPSYLKRLEERNSQNAIVVVKLGVWEEDNYSLAN